MRTRSLSIVLVAVGCHGAPPHQETPPALRRVGWDTAAARRICVAPDSVIAGTKECVLRDQGVRVREITPPLPGPRP